MQTPEELQAAVLAMARKRRAEVLAMRRRGMSLKAIAEILQVSTQRVSKMEKDAIRDEENVSRGTGEKG